MARYRIISNVELTNHFPLELDLTYFAIRKTGRWVRLKTIGQLLARLGQVDAFVAFNPGIDEEIVAFVSKCILRRRSLIVFYDLILQKPESFLAKLVCRTKRMLFWGVDKFFCLHKDTGGYQSYYGIPSSKFSYIPFKANNYQVADQYRLEEKGYVLVCGASHRDYETFLRAIEQVGFPAKILLPDKQVASTHNTPFYEGNIPVNVMVVTGPIDASSWNRFLAESRIVVVPILERAIQAAGISVYLEAMALGRPVIVTEGPSTRGILTDEAEMVPPGDVAALAAALKKLWEYGEYRQQLAYRGRTYALSLGTTERLVKDILRNTMACLETRTIVSNV